MATLEENIKQAIADFNDIKDAIEEKGVDVPDGTDTKEYGGLIRSILTDNTDGSYDEGYADGQEAGHQTGYNEGYEKGNTDGYSQGHTEGWSNGYSQGYEGGKTDGYNEGSALKDQKPYIDTSELTSLDYWFSGVSMNNQTYENDKNIALFEKFDTSNVTHWIGTFRNNISFTELPEFNSDSALIAEHCFYGCTKMITSPVFNFSNVTSAKGCFAWCSNMVTVQGILDFGKQTTSLSEMFAQCKALKNVTFVENSIKVSVSFSASLVLTLDSLKSIIKGLYDYSGTENEYVYKLSLHADSKALLEAEGATAPNGLTWLEYVDSKGWLY